MYIADKPCLICGRTDVQAAHIRYTGAGIGQKPYKKVRERVYEHFQEENFKRFFEL